MTVKIKIEQNFENHHENRTVPYHQVPVNQARKIEQEEEEDSKLPAEDTTNLSLQADWAHRINQDVIIQSRVALGEYTKEESHLLRHFASGTENTWSGASTPDFPLVENNYILPVDIWVQVRASCECLRSRVLPFLTVHSADPEEEALCCSIIVLANSRLHFTQGFPAEWIQEKFKWQIPGTVQVDKKTFEQARFELWIYYYTCLKRKFNINYLLECIEANNLDTLYI